MISAEELVELAVTARERAYAPYSGYKVGAAVVSEAGEVATGCNIENLSFGATICAERVAITKLISEGRGPRISQVAVATADGGMPCGLCLQVISEFALPGSGCVVHAAKATGEFVSLTFDQLLPNRFDSEAVRRTETP